VSIVGTDVNAAIANQFLISDPDIGLDVFDQVTNVNWPVGVGEGTGDEQSPLGWFLVIHAKSLEPQTKVR
jgi:hypothetical protein